MATNSVESTRRHLRGSLVMMLLATALVVAVLPGTADARSAATATPVPAVSQNTGPSILPSFRLFTLFTYIWFGPAQETRNGAEIQTPVLTYPNLPEEPEPLIVTSPGVQPTKYLTNQFD